MIQKSTPVAADKNMWLYLYDLYLMFISYGPLKNLILKG